MSVDEILHQIQSYLRVRRDVFKRQLLISQATSNQIVSGIACLIDKGSKPITLWNMYPEFFIEEQEAYEKQKELEELERYKQQKREYRKRIKQRKG